MKIYLSGNDGNLRHIDFFVRVCLYGHPNKLFNIKYSNVKYNDRNAMDIFLAGGVTGNLRNEMKLYFADINTRKYMLEDRLELLNPFIIKNLKKINILESYYYLRDNELFMKIAQNFGSFMLDSGAFTFMQGGHKGEINWNKYTEDYADFINRYDIKLFFELDIDKIVGLDKVEKLRERLESLTGKKPIPVWHETRNKNYYIDMCRNYPYVAVGGVAQLKGKARQEKERIFPWMIYTAHKNGAKIHGLGFTSIGKLKIYHFDSVDSTAWLYGNRGGYLYKFNPQTGLIDKINNDKANSRLKAREGAIHNFSEWAKFSIYADSHL